MIALAWRSLATSRWFSAIHGALLRATLSSALAKFDADATCSSSRLLSAAGALRSLVGLPFAICSRKAFPTASSVGTAPLPPCGLSANTKVN
jgi:hypothetical protein